MGPPGRALKTEEEFSSYEGHLGAEIVQAQGWSAWLWGAWGHPQEETAENQGAGLQRWEVA